MHTTAQTHAGGDLSIDAVRVFLLASDGLALIGKDDRFLRVNPAFARTLGYAGSDLVGRSWWTLVHSDDHLATRAAVQELAAESPRCAFENRCRHRDGSYRRLGWTLAAETPDSVRVAVARDLTASVRRHDEETAAQQELDRLKDEFIATASHDLRAPLTSILGFAQFLHRKIQAPAPNLAQMTHGLAMIERQAKSMGRLIADLLDLSRVQAGQFTIQPAPCELGASLQTVLERLSPEARRRVDVSLPEAPLEGAWDRARVEQTLANLVDNALKYSPADGRVAVAIERRAGEVEVAVCDHGAGIPPEELPRLFDRFYRTPQALLSGLPGTGLGLSICRGIVEAHGGRIWAESAGERRGTTVRFVLPDRPVRCGAATDQREVDG